VDTRGIERVASRTVALGLAVLFALGSLAACGEADRAMSHIDESRLATPEHPVTSPSGRYRLGVVTGEYCGAEGTGEFWRVQIRDRDSELVLDSPRRFRPVFAPRSSGTTTTTARGSIPLTSAPTTPTATVEGSGGSAHSASRE